MLTMKNKQRKRARTNRRFAPASGCASEIGSTIGELMLVEYAINKAVKDMRLRLERVEHMARHVRQSYERLQSLRHNDRLQ